MNTDPLGRIDHKDIHRTCKQCGKQFIRQVDGAGYKYCSRQCMLDSKRKWDVANKHKRRLYHIERTYGIKAPEFERMMQEQDGRCAICYELIAYGGGRKLAHLDHDHDTKAVRGLLCAKCNAGLSHFNNDPNLLRLALRYLS